jgi:hypothetical protein
MAPKRKTGLVNPEAITKRKREAWQAMKEAAWQTKKQAPPLPKAADILIQTAELDKSPGALSVRPSQILVNRMCAPSVIIGIDVETHDFSYNETTRGRVGQFGWYTLKEESVIQSARLVQIGWAISTADPAQPVEHKSLFVLPCGFEVSPKIEEFTGGQASHEKAMLEGVPLHEALRVFMAEVTGAFNRGGRIVSHHLEFDAGIILCELQLFCSSLPFRSLRPPKTKPYNTRNTRKTT